MPTYPYVCEQGHEFEVKQRITEPALTICGAAFEHPKLGWGTHCTAPCKRLIAPNTSFVLKGSSWEKDGYK